MTTRYLKTEVFKRHSKRQRTVWISDLMKTQREERADLMTCGLHVLIMMVTRLNTHIIFIAHVDV